MAKFNLKEKHKCPICGKTEFPERNSYEICPVCGWEDDILDENDQDEITGANEYELSEYRERYNSGWRPDWVEDKE
ncbi:MAG: hypothetical protein LUG64_02145 [Clostridiales bacterium]|nr:hypothetical protein [Clostridiales bacterium]